MTAGGAELRILPGDFHRHTEISPDGAGDGSIEDYFRYMIDAAGMDIGIVSDHNAGLDEYTWWRTEKAHDLFHIPGGYAPLFGYERSVPYDPADPAGSKVTSSPASGLSPARGHSGSASPSGIAICAMPVVARGACQK